jgi:hypothetical protein
MGAKAPICFVNLVNKSYWRMCPQPIPKRIIHPRLPACARGTKGG